MATARRILDKTVLRTRFVDSKHFFVVFFGGKELRLSNVLNLLSNVLNVHVKYQYRIKEVIIQAHDFNNLPEIYRST